MNDCDCNDDCPCKEDDLENSLNDSEKRKEQFKFNMPKIVKKIVDWPEEY